MASTLKCIFFIYATLLLRYVISPTLAWPSTKYIDKICRRTNNKTFCVRTLTAYPPAAGATGLFPLAEAVINLAVSHAEKSANLATAAANKMPSLKSQFTKCGEAFVSVETSLKSAALELKESPDTANYDVMVCTDYTKNVKDLIGRNSDKASKIFMRLTLEMEKLLEIAVAATEVVGG